MKVAIIYNKDFTGVINQFGMQNKEKYNPKTIKMIADALEQGGHNVRIIDGAMEVIDHLQAFMPKVVEGERMGMVFNLAYGIQGESRYTHLPAMLEMLGIPYVGSGPSGHALALDKVITKIILQRNRIPTPDFWVFSTPNEDMSDVIFPVIVKPKMEAVSYGLKIVNNVNDLKDAVEFVVKEFQQQALVERFIQGREFAVGLLGNGGNLEAFPVVEIDLKGDPNAIQSVADKKRHPKEKLCPAPIDNATAQKMKEISQAVFSSLDLRDFARVDLRMDTEGNIYVLEINSMASLGRTGSYVYAALVCGYDFNQLVNKMLDVAAVRYFSDAVTRGSHPPCALKLNKQSYQVRIRGFLRSHQEKLEKLLKKMVGINSYVRNVDGVNELGQLVWQQLSPLGFTIQVIPQVEAGNILLMSNGKDSNYDMLLLGSLDCLVPFSRQISFHKEQNRFLGTGIWESKGGLVMAIGACQTLRFIRKLRRLNVGMLLIPDESLQGRFSADHVALITSRVKAVIGISGSALQSTAVTSRSGAMVYNLEMNLTRAETADDVTKAVSGYSQLVAEIALLSSKSKGIVAFPKEVSIRSSISDLTAMGSLSVSVRFTKPELADEIDQKIKRLVAKYKRKKLRVNVEGGLRRRPMQKTEAVDALWQKTAAIARKMDIRIAEEHRLSSGSICFVPAKIPKLDGLGPVGGITDKKGEFILRYSLPERAALLAMLMIKLGERK
jgi:D-alanine-D-alanine ligase